MSEKMPSFEDVSRDPQKFTSEEIKRIEVERNKSDEHLEFLGATVQKNKNGEVTSLIPPEFIIDHEMKHGNSEYNKKLDELLLNGEKRTQHIATIKKMIEEQKIIPASLVGVSRQFVSASKELNELVVKKIGDDYIEFFNKTKIDSRGGIAAANYPPLRSFKVDMAYIKSLKKRGDNTLYFKEFVDKDLDSYFDKK